MFVCLDEDIVITRVNTCTFVTVALLQLLGFCGACVLCVNLSFFFILVILLHRHTIHQSQIVWWTVSIIVAVPGMAFYFVTYPVLESAMGTVAACFLEGLLLVIFLTFFNVFFPVILKRLIVWRLIPGVYPVYGFYYVRWW